MRLRAISLCRWSAAILPVALTFGCSDAPHVLRLATTTSVRDSGLLDQLLPIFEADHHCRVDVIAVGTGAALALGRAGDADVLIVHSRPAEEAFMAAGHGVRHEEFMVNYFSLAGPADDQAQIANTSPVTALQRIASGNHPFVSRGDDSGTHKRELSLWQSAGGRPEWDRYIESGQGMGPTLLMADEMESYLLTDMGTYLKMKDRIDLVPLVTSLAELRNPYAVIVVNPEIHPAVKRALADALAEFLISDETQRLIGGYQISGQQLFSPTRLTD